MTVMFRGRPACTCLATWLPAYEAELLRRGVIEHSIDIYQLIGGATASAGTHATGGAFDIAQTSREAIAVARQMGADATWHRTPAQGFPNHTHGVLRGCPHNGPARYQIDAVDAGYNGLGHAGRGGKDDGPRPLSKRTWREGIAWAKEQAQPTVDEQGRAARARWMKIREKRGQLRPIPLRRTQVNAQGATASAALSAGVVIAASKFSDLMTLCEVANIDVAKVLGQEWNVAQDRSTWAKAGSAIAVRESRGEIVSWRLRLGVLAKLGRLRAKQMNDRHVVVATVKLDPTNARRRWQYKVAAGHPPPRRNWAPWWDVFMRALKLIPAHDIGCDWNKQKPAVQKVFPRRVVRMHHIDGFVLRPWLPSTPVTTRDVGSDHDAVTTILWPSNKEKS